MAKKPTKTKRCSCGATNPRDHIQASMMGAGVHPYTGPRP